VPEGSGCGRTWAAVPRSRFSTLIVVYGGGVFGKVEEEIIAPLLRNE
jgi:hypothetical protein